MKKLFLYAMTAFAAFAVLSCEGKVEIPDDNKEDPDEHKEDPPQPPVEEEKTAEIVFQATIELFPDGTQPQWAKGDQISIFDGENIVTATNSEEAGEVAKFKATVLKNATVVALYPALENPNITAQGVTLEIPATQEIGKEVPQYKVAKSSGNMLSFKHLVSTVYVSVGMEGVTKVEFAVNEGALIAGSVNVNMAADDPVTVAATNKVVLTGTFEAGKEYPVVIVPAEFTSYSITAYAGEDVAAESSGDAFWLAPGVVVSMPTLMPAPPVYQISHMWVWGGTGPEYGGTKIIDLFTVPQYFDDTEGRGIEAIKDNYFVLGFDGKIYNWAGEDGKNWWYVYDASVNPETKKDIDIKDLYEVLPRSVGDYTIDPETGVMTFTLEDGKQTAAKYMPAGTYALPDTKEITVEEPGLMFELSGKDNWDYIYKDYDIIACRPRILFIELHQMPDGFEVPEASKTTDKDFEFVPEPDDPVVEFDFSVLPGKWNVYGNNSEGNYGIWVLGGSGDDPAFVSPIAKSWDWNDSIWRESDNGLVVKVTGQNGTVVSGTINWWAGDDGKFWDYKWNKTDPATDLSEFYDVIPKGESQFTMDLATLDVTLSNGKTPKFLTPGEHEFVYGKKFTVKENCFALDFHIMDPIEATNDRWNDVDRFVNAPLEYVIMFEKVGELQ